MANKRTVPPDNKRVTINLWARVLLCVYYLRVLGTHHKRVAREVLAILLRNTQHRKTTRLESSIILL